jgi:Ca-activated chloride channel family protein
MDEKRIDDILSNISVPEIDQNAKKRAVNLSSAAFSEELKKNEKKSQGLGILSRLMNITKQKTNGRNSKMDKKQAKSFLYGGMATAMVAIVAIGLSDHSPIKGALDTQSVDSALFAGGQQVTADSKAPVEQQIAMAEVADERQMSPLNKGNVNEADKMRVEEAIRSGSSALPQKIARKDNGEMARAPKEAAVSNPVVQWERNRSEGKADTGAIVSEQYAGKKQKSFADISNNIVSSAPAPSPQLAGRAYSADKLEMAAPSSVVGNRRHIIMPIEPPYDDEDVYYQDQGRDNFQQFKENAIKIVKNEPVSTFSVDVDTSSYSFIRKQISYGNLPSPDAVRVEELVNYFDYNYELPKKAAEPFKASVNITESPWAEGKKLMHIGIKGYDIDMTEDKPRTNLVFLLDVSGSMNSPDKLPLVKSSMKLLLETLDKNDTVAIAVYAGAAGTVLEPTKVADKRKIFDALNNLSAGGGTAGARGINLAYDLAEQNFDEDAINRVILATDGDFNVGVSSPDALKKLVESKRDKGIFLSVLGFGQGNFNDHIMQSLAQNGNGIAAYIDSLAEAQKVLVEEASSTLFTIAKDVKLQVEFNPTQVAEYRLVGYETRHLNREDFNNDKVDAGDIGAGHTVTAIYEITPVGSKARLIDENRYGSNDRAVETTKMDNNFSGEYGFLKIRYKLPNENRSKLITQPITKDLESGEWNQEALWATAVASYAQLLKGGSFTGEITYDDVIDMATASRGTDMFGYRAEFINMVRLTKSIAR